MRRFRTTIRNRDTSGEIIIIVVDGGLSLFEMGEILSERETEGGFSCEQALNLDGGPATQVSFAGGGEKLELPGRWKVPNALVVIPK